MAVQRVIFSTELLSHRDSVILPSKPTASRERTGYSVVCPFCTGQLVGATRSPAGNKRQQLHTIMWKDLAATVLLRTALSSGVQLKEHSSVIFRTIDCFFAVYGPQFKLQVKTLPFGNRASSRPSAKKKTCFVRPVKVKR